MKITRESQNVLVTKPVETSPLLHIRSIIFLVLSPYVPFVRNGLDKLNDYAFARGNGTRSLDF